MRDTFDTLDFPKNAELRWLLAQGITGEAMASPWPIRGSSVIFDGNVFSFADAGSNRAVIFRAEDFGATVDLIAWQPRTGQLATWCGVGFCLGNADNIHNPGTYFDGGSLHVHGTPLEWLRADRDGIVIVQWRDAYGRLRFCPRAICSNELVAAKVDKHTKPPKRSLKILVANDNAEEIAA
jgi:hypothetical protein